MDLNEEFHKETGMQADDGYRYTDYYVEWLESKLEANQKDIEVWHENLIKKKNYKVNTNTDG
jgi:hypothetical protein